MRAPVAAALVLVAAVTPSARAQDLPVRVILACDLGFDALVTVIRAKPNPRVFDDAAETAIQVIPEHAISSITKPGHYAHPAVVLTQFDVGTHGTIVHDSCGYGSKEGLARFLEEFKQRDLGQFIDGPAREAAMKSAVIVFPASNCDRDAQVALKILTGKDPAMVWHADAAVPDDVDLIVLPGGFSYGDYLRSGAMAAQSRVMRDVLKKGQEGRFILGICNGFQVLTETHMLPGALMKNADLKFACRPVGLRVEESQSAFTRKYDKGQIVHFPVAHGDGNYFADEETLNRLEGEGRVVFRYAPGENPNGSIRDIAGILNEKRNVMGLMPHPERVCDPLLGGTDGVALFQSLIETLS